jgi:hypothetical protein
MSHLALAFGFIGRLYAIDCALAYDLSDLPRPHPPVEMAGRLWRTNMAAWKLTHGRDT